MSAEKRPASPEKAEESDSDAWIGPMPSEAAISKPKKRKVLEFESLYLENLPSSETYERSYMHRDVVSHIVVTKTDFVITARGGHRVCEALPLPPQHHQRHCSQQHGNTIVYGIPGEDTQSL
ncbi:hypothetical protein MSG28_008424 [Choristoneura fumiferana]|uniref:Uncharacterized protein n=1 Tax=Choristoneura fumiferana TaxID=7141 RepID=A0ACC0J612_CHOFU|nr:hypothetical protein MSG28_008424 [Choristoneura fumiferana]